MFGLVISFQILRLRRDVVPVSAMQINDRYGALLFYNAFCLSIYIKRSCFEQAVVKFPILGGKRLMITCLAIFAAIIWSWEPIQKRGLTLFKRWPCIKHITTVIHCVLFCLYQYCLSFQITFEFVSNIFEVSGKLYIH